MIPQIKPTKKQMECWKLLQDAITNYILYGGSSGSGKSYLSCSWLLVMCCTYPNIRAFVGRSELKAIRASWLQTFYKVVRDSGLEPSQTFKLNAIDNYLSFPNGSRIDFLDLGDEPSDPFFERLGSYEFTFGVIEEAGEVSQNAFDMLKSRVGRCMNVEHKLHPKILLTCNPSKGWLYGTFYVPSIRGELQEGYAMVQALPKDNPHLPDYTEQLMLITDVGQRERLLGNWEFDANISGLINYQAILDAFSGPVDMKVKRGTWYISADLAGRGNDSTCIIVWCGLRVERIVLYDKLTGPEVVDRILKLKQQYNVALDNIVVDADSLGGPISEMMPGVRQFINGSSPLEIAGTVQNYANLKTQCYTKLAELINEREIFISCDVPSIKENLIQELEQVKLKDGEGKLQLIPKSDVKKAIGRSPDSSDALMMRMIYELKPPTTDVVFSVFNDYERPYRPDESRINFNDYSRFPTRFI